MGIKDRKSREQETFRKFVVERAYELIKDCGCEALTMRKLAKSIEWSTQKLYSNFSNKDELLIAIDAYLRGRIWGETQAVPRDGDPGEYVIALVSTTLHFFLREPAAMEVLKEVRYKKECTPSPDQDKAQQLFREALAALKCPYLDRPEAFEEALETIRVMLAGAGECIPLALPHKRVVIISAVVNGLRALFRGWGYQENS